ncbi:hypothetical protein CBM2592_A280128 [Cupriavidus taiwanensis]|nr:hypothetical protein CBM2592_A280128 [Cupriavidus taiwanensis]SOY85786.1 hypothetical protein CBM2591_A320128 [Cupriavidus taiwanensis]SPD44898.1 protein of unknown function [Cupriavidus taiwanensis]
MTRVTKGIRSFLLAEAKNHEPFFPNACCQTCKIAVAGHQAKTIEPSGIQQVHSIDDEGAICRILPGGIGELLHRFDGVFVEHLLPGGATRRGEVTINSLHGSLAKSRDFGKNSLNNGRLGIVGIYEDSEPQGRCFGFDFGDDSGRYHHVARRVRRSLKHNASIGCNHTFGAEGILPVLLLRRPWEKGNS